MKGLYPRVSIRTEQRDQMFSLLARHFEGVTRDQFENDLAEKNWVLEIRRDQQLLGFSTLLLREAEFQGQPITVVYSGDTIVAPEAWGSPILARSWIAAVNTLRSPFPNRPCYWLLLTSGFRTYRFLPVFWRSFYPRCNETTPPAVQQLMSELARQQYGSRYDGQAGVVRFPHPQRLRGRLAEIPPGRITDPDVAFFLQRNPGHQAGDELVCMTQIDEANLSPAGRRMVGA